MRHCIRNSVVALFTYSGLAYLYRTLARRHGPLVRIIAFHDVENGTWFEEIIATLSRDTHLLAPGDLKAEAFDAKKINVLVTFDDGYASWVDVCAPILKKYDVQALFFVNSGLVIQPSGALERDAFVQEKLRLSPKRTIGIDGVRALIASGHTIGGHTTSHTSLRGADEDMIRSEVATDKNVLETTFGIELEHFAYPFGTVYDFAEMTGEAIHRLGYPFVYTAEPGFYQKGAVHIPRTLIEKEQPHGQFLRWLFGSYDLFAYLKRAFHG